MECSTESKSVHEIEAGCVQSLYEILRQVPDHRDNRGKRYEAALIHIDVNELNKVVRQWSQQIGLEREPETLVHWASLTARCSEGVVRPCLHHQIEPGVAEGMARHCSGLHD